MASSLQVKRILLTNWRNLAAVNYLSLRHCGANGLTVEIRGGVEATRLEAKAKDTKKIRGQGQSFRGQTSRGQGQECSRPRPRTNDTVASVFQKKMSSKIFFRQSLLYRRNQNF